ncbi:uncharacterized protein LOC111674820 isoform X4 [Lucilia cuprina]|uniref:uncharacterized protein LOC111674820 isoform X4 n=1 Tax=Lucilia cuprina TaxID=7375 RepID=UPI001F0644A2|nr:uncharacterized protein LOC111674820 isoform X4 [Lucilia cuprina]
MAAPFNLEDLAKLKSFVEFVAANPAILNLPQLDFLKKLIEQLGGKVPEGTFQMPAGAKCPFGGDVKSENKPTPASAEAEVDEEEIPEMEAESEESEVELDMEADSSQRIFEPNVLILEDKPRMIVKDQKLKRDLKATKKGVEKKIISKTRKSVASQKKTDDSQQNVEVKMELNNVDEQMKIDKIDPNDPLLTPQIELKYEKAEDLLEYNVDDDEDESEEYSDSKADKDYCVDECEEDDDDDEEEEYDFKGKWREHISDSENEVTDEEEEKSDGHASTKKKLKKNTPYLYNCIETCKHKCITKYDKRQRIDIFDYYTQLNKDDKVEFIRKHIRKPVIQLIRKRKRRNNCCYFLKYYKIGQDSNNKCDSDDLTKVCRKFFVGTLGITHRDINEAIEGYELQPERIVLPVKNSTNEDKTKLTNKSPNKTQKPQQFLDPETGNLTDSKPKKSSKRRKKGEPQPQVKRFPKPINCAIRCKFKCHQNFSEEERKLICDRFWSLEYKRRKDYVLAHIETADVKSATTPEFRKTDRPTRAYQSKFYLGSGIKNENKRVCKHFMLNTLSIDRWFIENAIEFADKTTGSYMGTDRRGTHPPYNKVSDERIQAVKDNISSFPCWLPNKNSKIKYLHHSLSIKKMYAAYKQKCLAEQKKHVCHQLYYKVFNEDFRLLFLSNPHPTKGSGWFSVSNSHISKYTGEEAGGYWIDSKGNKLDIQSSNTAQSCQYNSFENVSEATSLPQNPYTPDTFAHHALNVANSASFMPLTLVENPSVSSSAIDVAKSYLNPALYEKFAQNSDNI